MRILLVDDEDMALKHLSSIVSEVALDADIMCFDDCDNAIAEAKRKNFDVAFLDISMPEKD